MTNDERAQLNARIGTLQAIQDLAQAVGKQFKRRLAEDSAPPEEMLKVDALVHLSHNELTLKIREHQALLPPAEE